MTQALLIAALWGTTSFGGPTYAATDSTFGPEQVPFVAQEPLLCGGAAAAMVLRFWGERGVHGDDFGHLVQEERGGIATTDLVAALRQRGLTVRTVPDSPDAVFDALDDGVPSILLLEGRPTLHYVVLVRVDGDDVWVHDPNFGPERRLSRPDLMEKWSASGRWALLAFPGPPLTEAEGDRHATPESSKGQKARNAPPEPSEGQEERSATIDSAMTALRAGDHEMARAVARTLLDDPSRSAVGRRILATSFYLEGEEEEALRHWNTVSEPRIDLVEIRGARQTRHHVLARRLGLEPGAILTEADLRLGRRRLSDVDALRRVRVSYEPLAGGDVEVRAYVQARSRWPGLRSGALRLATAVVDRRASIEIGPLMASGDRWRADGRLSDAQTFAAGEVSTASLHLPGTVSLGLEWRRERFGDPSGGVSAEERLGGTLGLRDWLTPSVRAEGRLGLDRWRSGARMASAGLSAVWSTRDDGLRITGTADHWRGSALPYTRADLTVRGVRSVGDAADVRIEAGLSAASVDAPRMVWPGAGAGEVRDALLRGHPLAEDGAIRGPAFGRNLLHGTLEVRAFERVGPVLPGGSAFLDAARSWNGPGADASHRLVDPGLGAFLDTGENELLLDAALGERGWVLSAWVRSER